MTPPLWHYTCRHAARQIGYFGVLRPMLCPWFRDDAPRVVWLTDLDTPDVDGLGLTSRYLTCDRTARRYQVLDATDAKPWTDVRNEFADQAWVDDAEALGRPEHWYVCQEPVRVKLAVPR